MNRQIESSEPPRPHAAVVEALRLLGKRCLALAIHDSSFPSLADEEIGRGTPYGEGARAFLRFIRGLGFEAVQFGPQGQTARDNPSPYDGTLFSRNILNLDLASLAGGAQAWLSRKTLDIRVAQARTADRIHSHHSRAFDATHAALKEIHQHFVERRDRGDADALRWDRELRDFTRREFAWLYPDALYHVLAQEQAWRHHRDWRICDQASPLRDLYPHAVDVRRFWEERLAQLPTDQQHAIERYRLGQYLLHRQHARLRSAAQGDGLRIYGDLQIGISACDEWSRSKLYLKHYLMGAPPSRTNPAGQPWGYGVLDPGQYLEPDGAPGPVLKFLKARVNKMLQEFDGLRIDHPHGLVSPWVYLAGAADPYRAVQQGARLFSSPNLPDHPELAHYAIARAEQLDTSLPRYADGWVRELDPRQVERYALLMDLLVDAVRTQSGTIEEVLCEVLSTLPYPLARIIERHGLGRFRVTQKADLENPSDVYRSENARPEDWIMAGNHDTPPIWRLAKEWIDNGQARRQADYLAWRLAPEASREAFAREIAGDRRKLVHAKLADVLASPATHVMIFFADLLGMEEIYNRPGSKHPENWSLRVPPDFAETYPALAARGEALNIPSVLALALRARGAEFTSAHRDLIGQLQQLGGWWN
jgi:4-alpha-glucanotransferase